MASFILKLFVSVKDELSGIFSLARLVSCVAGFLPQGAMVRTRRVLLKAAGHSIGHQSVFTDSPTFSTLHGEGMLFVGEKCFFNIDCLFDLTADVVIGNRVNVGCQVRFITSGHSVNNPNRRAGEPFGKPITVKEGSWIGAGAILLPGVTIGAGAVVAAGSIVTKDVADNSLVAGIPAESIKWL